MKYRVKLKTTVTAWAEVEVSDRQLEQFANEGTDCCVDVLVREHPVDQERPPFGVGFHVQDCRCLVRDGAVLNVDLRCNIP